MPFIHLNIHSEFSLVDGIVRLKPLAKAASEQGMFAVALTDYCNLFGMVKFYRACIAAKVKPIIGAEILVASEGDADPSHLILLCQNQVGYRNLTMLISEAYLHGQTRDKPLLSLEVIEKWHEGLIALSGGLQGSIGRALLANKTEMASHFAKQWSSIFPNRFYLTLQRTQRPDEERYNQATVRLAEQLQLPVVATNDVRFLSKDDFEAHEARVCINRGDLLSDSRRQRDYSEAQYFRTPEEMTSLFSDVPEAIENTIEIAKRCNLQLTLDKHYLPTFPVPTGMTLDSYLASQAEQGLEKRFKELFTELDETSDIKQQYQSRLAHELKVITSMGFAGYFLVVADFIQWAKENDIPVGPGRGSGAGSLVAYALGITDLNPLDFDLLFERFLNPERVSMPDFDIDFCMDGRDRVIDYVAEKYGRDTVSQIITYGSMAAKAVVRDVGRVLGHPYGFVDKIAKLIPFEIGMTLEKALQQDETLLNRYYDEEEVKTLIDLGMKLEGITRNVGKHAGGVVIAPSRLTDFVPLYCEADGSNLVTQFDKDDVESVGLVKFDFLGLRTLTIIDWALKKVNKLRRDQTLPPININNIPLDDKDVFKLLKACNTTAVFQLESRGMKDLIKRLQPDAFEEIIALVALFRPGPLQSGMVDDFIDRKHGRAKVVYPHLDLETILKPTYGVILYQEQVMQIAQVLAGYTLGAADLLRRAMGKKKPEEMAKQRTIFVDGASGRGVDPEVANNIFDLMEKFAGYGFNKSHSATYALLSYQTAWLKTHYPAQFMAAVLSSDMDNTDKVVGFIQDCERNGLKISPPNVNQSEYQFTVNKEGVIIYGMGAIKGVGESAIEAALTERNTNGPFKDLFDFTQRVDTRKVNRRVLEALVRSGAMDGFQQSRATLFVSIDSALRCAEQNKRAQECGQSDLFGFTPDETAVMHVEYVHAPDWSDRDRLTGEKETLGFYLTGHPIQEYENELKYLVKKTIRELRPTENKQTTKVAGFITSIRTMFTKKNTRMAIVSLEDRTANIEVAVFSEVFEEARPLLIKDQLIIIDGEVSIDDYTGGYRMSAREIIDLDIARQRQANILVLNVGHASEVQTTLPALQSLLAQFKHGNCAVCLSYQSDGATAKFLLGDEWRVFPSAALLAGLRELYGANAVEVKYR